MAILSILGPFRREATLTPDLLVLTRPKNYIVEGRRSCCHSLTAHSLTHSVTALADEMLDLMSGKRLRFMDGRYLRRWREEVRGRTLTRRASASEDGLQWFGLAALAAAKQPNGLVRFVYRDVHDTVVMPDLFSFFRVSRSRSAWPAGNERARLCSCSATCWV